MNLKQRDKKHIWHPLTQHKTAAQMLPIVKSKGCSLTDFNGKVYIDAIASWYTAMYGHCNPYLIEKLTLQASELDQIVFSGFTHLPAIELSEKLMGILPINQQKIFFSDNGSTSVDVALKMAIQFYHNNGQKHDTVITFEDGFHGDTFGAMSVSGLSVYNGAFEDFFIKVIRIPTPDKNNIEHLKIKLIQILKEHSVFAFIYEPLVQGAAGMKMHCKSGLNELLALFSSHNILTIADEVMTGFGKTGTYFASDQIETKPDIMCLSKSLSAGMLPLALTTCTQLVFDAFYDNELAKGFFHGHTYSANPLACAVAGAAIDLLQSSEIQDKITKIIASHSNFKAKLDHNPKVKNVRVLGVIFAFELDIVMDRYGKKRDDMFQYFMDNGIFLRPLGNTIYILPPFVISNIELQKIYTVIIQFLKKV